MRQVIIRKIETVSILARIEFNATVMKNLSVQIRDSDTAPLSNNITGPFDF